MLSFTEKHTIEINSVILDIDECIENRNLCFDGRCENTHGSYTCVCDLGYGVQEVGYNPRCIGKLLISFNTIYGV